MIVLNNKIKNSLFSAAQKALSNAYAPYSNYKVGAALITDDGEIFSGCNVENSSYGLTVCAERNAIAAAIASGKRNFSVILVLTQDDNPGTPCGACRQVISEFFPPDSIILLANEDGIQTEHKLSALLPFPFKF